MTTRILACLALFLGAATIWADDRKSRLWGYLFRPLTMASIIGIALAGKNETAAFYQTAILAGLIFSSAGDVCMMQARKRFTAGLAMFFIAQICFLLAFSTGLKHPLSFWPIIPFFIFMLGFLGFLFPHLGKMKIPVLIYVPAIVAMACAAAERCVQFHDPGSSFALAGALLFVLSDSVLAVNRFVKPCKSGQKLILSTYFLAQILIALSI